MNRAFWQSGHTPTLFAAFLYLISPDPQPPVAGCASPTAEHTAT